MPQCLLIAIIVKWWEKNLSGYNCCVNLAVINEKEGTVFWQYFSPEHTENVFSDWWVLLSW